MVGFAGKRRRVVSTLNNYTPEELVAIQKETFTNLFTLIIVGKEIGELNGTPHLQCFFSFGANKSAITFDSWRRLFDNNGLQRMAEIDEARGTPQQNFKYCSKQGNVLISKGFAAAGILTGGPGKSQTKVTQLVQAVWEGKNWLQLLRNKQLAGSALIYGKQLELMRSAMCAEVYRTYRRPVRTLFLWGDTATGKSEFIFEHFSKLGCDFIPLARDTGKAWMSPPGAGEQIVIIDDGVVGSLPFSLMSQLAQGFPVQMEYKGGHRYMTHNLFVITSNFSPEQFWANTDPVNWPAIQRRLTYVWKCSRDGADGTHKLFDNYPDGIAPLPDGLVDFLQKCKEERPALPVPEGFLPAPVPVPAVAAPVPEVAALPTIPEEEEPDADSGVEWDGSPVLRVSPTVLNFDDDLTATELLSPSASGIVVPATQRPTAPLPPPSPVLFRSGPLVIPESPQGVRRPRPLVLDEDTPSPVRRRDR